MSVWQFDLYVIQSEFQASDTCSDQWPVPLIRLPLAYNIQEELAHYLGVPWLMLTNWLVFGPEKGNRVDIVFQSDTDASVSVRCDLKEEAPQFLALAADLVRFHGCRFFSPQIGQIIEPDLEDVLDAIRRSQTTKV